MPDGYDHLVSRLGGGACVLDADGVPPLDLFFPARLGESRLFIARGGFDYEEQSIDAGDAIGCLAFDADVDGDADLLVTGVGTLRLLLHEGASFVDGSALLDASVVPSHVYASAAAGDVDDDGDVDLVVAGFLDAADVPSGHCGSFPCAVLIAELPLDHCPRSLGCRTACYPWSGSRCPGGRRGSGATPADLRA